MQIIRMLSARMRKRFGINAAHDRPRSAVWLCLCLMVLCLMLSGCSSSSSGASSGTADVPEALEEHRSTVTQIRMPETDGSAAVSNGAGTVTIDYSHPDQGYVCILYTGDSQQVQIQLCLPDGTVSPYPLEPGAYQTFLLTGGSGRYQVNVMESVGDGRYAAALSLPVAAQISDELVPFTWPSQYVNYSQDSECVKLAVQLSDASATDLDYITSVYGYVTEHVTYDKELAANAPVNYIPDPDATLSSGKGICFDYASLMTAMLRCQQIPTRLEVGYSGTAYHAWISVYLEESGWIENIISFDGESWTLVDPTLGASNNASSVSEYIGDGSNYIVKYHY